MRASKSGCIFAWTDMPRACVRLAALGSMWRLKVADANLVGVLALLGSCFLGYGISHTGTALRSKISATAFNITGKR